MTITATSRIPTNENAMGISILYGSSCPSSNGSNSADVLYEKKLIYMYICLKKIISVGLYKQYPTMHYFGNPGHTQSMIAYKISTEYLREFRFQIALWKCC